MHMQKILPCTALAAPISCDTVCVDGRGYIDLEPTGLHPLQLDRASSMFAAKILFAGKFDRPGDVIIY